MSKHHQPTPAEKIQSIVWMVNDIELALKPEEGKAIYLAALGLFCYTEIIGKWMLILHDRKKEATNEFSFNFFITEYMGYKSLVRNHQGKIYAWFRHGLAHEYYIQRSFEGYSGVYVTFSEKNMRQGIKIMDEKRFL